MSGVPQWRQIIIEQLRVLASERGQLEYERNVPHVDITVELVCGWFDDSYHPEDAHFCSCFTDEELAALADFTATFQERKAHLPVSNGTVTSWLASPSWRELMRAASRTLARLAA